MIKRLLLASLITLFSVGASVAQYVISDWETEFKYFLTDPPIDTAICCIANPHPDNVNSSENVMQITRFDSGYVSAYTDLNSYLNFTNTNSISFKVFSQSAGKIVLLLIDDDGIPKIIEAYYALPGQWQELRYNTYFSSAENNIYKKISIYIDPGSEPNWYVDDIQTLAIGQFSSDTIIDFDNSTYGFMPLKGSNSMITEPDIKIVADTMNFVNHVLQIESTTDLYESGKCILDRKLNFSSNNTISMKVLSSKKGFVNLMLMNDTISGQSSFAKAYYFTPGEWQELDFNFHFTEADNDTYDVIYLFPDYYSDSAGVNWYFDDLYQSYTKDFDADIISDFDLTTRSFFPESEAEVNKVTNPLINDENPGAFSLCITTSMIDTIEGGVCILESNFDFSEKNSISLKVLSDIKGPILMKIWNTRKESEYKISKAYYFNPGSWQDLNFNFYTDSTDNRNYDAITIYPDFFGKESSNNWYIDDVGFTHISPISADTICNFDHILRSFQPEQPIYVGISTNPDSSGKNTSSFVLDIKTSDDEYEGAVCMLDSYLDFSEKNSFSLKVFSEKAGRIVVKLFNQKNEINNIPVHGYYFTPNEWQEIKFNFLKEDGSADSIDAFTIYPDFDQDSTDCDWYFDDILFEKILPFRDEVIADFDYVHRYFEDYDVLELDLSASNPDTLGLNPTHNCLMLKASNLHFENIKTTLESTLDLSLYEQNAINVMVYSGTIGDVLLKLTGPGGYDKPLQKLTYNQPGTWQELSFDINGINADSADAITIFPDFDNDVSAYWYFDQITFDHNIDLTDYSNWEDKVLDFIGLGTNTVSQVTNPNSNNSVNNSANVLKLDCIGSAPWGTYARLDSYIDYSSFAVHTLNFLTSEAVTVTVRLEGLNVPIMEVSSIYSSPGQWQQLSFNFAQDIQTDVYDQISILLNHSGLVCYIDDVTGPALVNLVDCPVLHADWDTVKPIFETWGEIDTITVQNPIVAGINKSNTVFRTTTNSNTYEGFAFYTDGFFNMDETTSFSVDIFSLYSGNLEFKIEGPVDTASIRKSYTKNGSWQQLVFSFDTLLSNVFNKVAVFPDIDGTGTSDWYIDNIRGPGLISRALYLKSDYIAEGREDGQEIQVSLLGDSFAENLNAENWNVSGLSGVSIDSVFRNDASHAKIILTGNSSGRHLQDFSIRIVVDEQEFSGTSGALMAELGIIALGEFPLNESEARQKRVFVHYMPWYNTDSLPGVPAYDVWHDDSGNAVYANEPLVGEYSQMDEAVLEYHFLTMHAAGIDGIILNINPSITRDVILAESILNKLCRMNLAYSTLGFDLDYIISYDHDNLNPEDYSAIYNELQFIKDSFINNPADSSCRFNDDRTGFPVFLTWSHLGDQDTSYHNAIESLYNGDIVHIKRDPNDFGSANANFQWINYFKEEVPPEDSVYYYNSYWGEDYYQDFDSIMANQHLSVPSNERNYLMMGAVWPGFDDSNATWSKDRWINRNVTEGETMSLTFDEMINFQPGDNGLIKVELPWIQVVTWNDWPEGATIEPATAEFYGFKALQTTMLKTAEFKGEDTPSYMDSLALTIPYEIYMARKNGNMALAECAISEFLNGNYSQALSSCQDAYEIMLDVPYVSEEADTLAGAACVKMILDYQGTNNFVQESIHEYAVGQNYNPNTDATYIDPYGMYRALNYFELESGYNYAPQSRSSSNDAFHDICYWISNTIPNTSRNHLPSVIPVGGTFENWFVVNGFQSSANPHDQSSYTIYGFYVTDPEQNGVGNKMFIQASILSRNYFLPMNTTDIWKDQYISINEPPEKIATVLIEPERTSSYPSNDNMRFRLAEQAILDYNLNGNTDISNILSEGYQDDRIYFVDLDGSTDDYYIVTFSKTGNGDCVLAVVLDATDGAMKLVSYNMNPDYSYYSKLENGCIDGRLKPDYLKNNLLFPATKNLSKLTAKDNEPLIRILPNPASDFIRIETEENFGQVNISLMDVSGRLVLSKEYYQLQGNTMSIELNINNLQPGIYIVNFKSKKANFSKRIIIV